jgi:hypothetical protein
MAYFKINNVDFSQCVNKLKVTKDNIYKSMTNAAGTTLVKYITSKRIIEVGIIPLDEDALKELEAIIDRFKLSISFTDPKTGVLQTTTCILPSHNVEYYTIQAGKVMTKAFSLKFEEL